MGKVFETGHPFFERKNHSFDTNVTSGESLPVEVDEVKIWNEFVQGDERALAYIYRSYAKKTYQYCRQFTKNDQLIWDAIQDMFFDLMKNRDKLSLPKSLKAYLFSSIRRKLHRQLEKENKYELRDGLDDDNVFQMQLSRESIVINDNLTEEQKKTLESACNQLPTKQREAILLMYYEGLTYEEIATIMGMSRVKSARALIYRAIDSLSLQLSTLKGKLILILLAMGI
ncbi:sigma-70 family RNA polymerase sigma factor [Reichenbachiella sp. MALMAid0571]|uniref:RNA polymerase sigma factor n=1 Tax=Reichenbachiella sp. MALMAid0571 TaxID=3143939 RepID=UPI0032DFB2E7